MRRAVIIVSLWLGLALVSTGVGLATVGVLQQRVGEAVSRPLTSAEVAAALDDDTETVPAVPGLTRPTDEDDGDAGSGEGTADPGRSASFAPADDDGAADDPVDDGGDDVTAAPRPTVTADPSRPTGSGGGGGTDDTSDVEKSEDPEQTTPSDRPTRSPRPTDSDRPREDDDRRPTDSEDRSGRDLARRAADSRRTTTLSRLHRARVATAPHREAREVRREAREVRRDVRREAREVRREAREVRDRGPGSVVMRPGRTLTRR